METDKITSSYLEALGETQFAVDATLRADGDELIKNVLSGTAKAYVDEIEMLNGEAHYTGAVVFDVLCIDESGQTHVLSEKIDANGKIENDKINAVMKPMFAVEVVDSKVDFVSESEVKMTATISIKLNAMATDTIDVLGSSTDDVQINKEHAIVNEVVSFGASNFEISESFEPKNNIRRVLLTSYHTDVKSTQAGTGYFTVEGEFVINCLLEVDTDEGIALKNFLEVLPFKEEIEDEKITKDDNVFAFVFARPQDVSVELVEDGSEDGTKTQTLQVRANLTVKYLATHEVEKEIPTDAFSMTNKTNIISGTFAVANASKLNRFCTTIESQTTIGEDEPRIAKICAISNEHTLVANASVNGDELTVEGVAYATVIYMTDDDVPALNSIDLEIPFSNKFDAPNGFEGNVFVTSDIRDVEAKAKRGKDINVSLDVCFLAYAYNTQSQVFVKDIELTEELIPNNYSLEMYIAPKGSTLWDVSKHMLVTEDVLLKQNPELVFPLESSQTIVHFKQRTK